MASEKKEDNLASSVTPKEDSSERTVEGSPEKTQSDKDVAEKSPAVPEKKLRKRKTASTKKGESPEKPQSQEVPIPKEEPSKPKEEPSKPKEKHSKPKVEAIVESSNVMAEQYIKQRNEEEHKARELAKAWRNMPEHLRGVNPKQLLYVSDGKGGYRIVPRPVWKPIMYFPRSPLSSFWTTRVDVWFVIITAAAFVLRFWRLDWPKYVVFDEVHFGKFASYYLTNTFFFDVHPPLGKLIFAAIGYWNNFDGSFLFLKIGEEFPYEVPYVIMRGASALCGALLIPVVYQIMIELGFTSRAALMACIFTLLDNSLQIQSRVIMLDSFVIFFTYLSIWGYLKVYHCRDRAYSKAWHGWLITTGVFLGLLLGVKYTGLIGIGCVGLLGLCDLWQLVADLAVDKWPEPNPPLHEDLFHLFGHMGFRGTYLLGIPLLINVLLFYVHFAVLTNSGPGNAFVSVAFQDTLNGTPPNAAEIMDIPDNATLLRYSSDITLRNKDVSCWLHSHKDLYPLKYPDGRGSSYQQQVTCYEFKDKNNHWLIRRPGDPADPTVPNDTSPVHNKDIVELVHVVTSKLLNSHDVAVPLSPANQEIAGYINYSTQFVPYLQWKIDVEGLSADAPIFWVPGKTKLKLIHEHSSQAMGCTGNRLPEWGFQQYEVATDRNTEGSNTRWLIDDLTPPELTDELTQEETELRNDTITKQRPRQRRNGTDDNTTMSFLGKYLEMQGRMLAAHGSLGDHQFGASPTQWPLLTKTLPYWLDNLDNAQITLIGNPILWWAGSLSVLVFLVIVMFHVLRRKRKIFDLPNAQYEQYWTSGVVLLGGWLAHYVPYFLLTRVLFLHHYLPALPFKFMLLSAVLEHGFIATANIDHKRWYSRLIQRAYSVCVCLFCLAVLASFVLYFPIAMGYPSLTKPQIQWLQWRETWDLLMH